jgi:glutamine synthetase
MSIIAPLTNSYQWLVPQVNYSDVVLGGCYQIVVGTENKEAPIRLIKCGNNIERFEVKTPDSGSNPNLTLGVLIAACMDGV